MFDTAQLVAMALGVLIPLLNGFITRYAAVGARVFLQIFMSAVAGFLTEWLGALNANLPFNTTQALAGWISTLVVALAVEAKVWAPLGVSDALKRKGVGSSTAPPAELRRAA
jgi:hypothetical protein